jgi:hypothetical protein
MVETWTGPGSPNVTVTVLYPPEYAASAAPALKAAKDSLTYFSNTLGPYPYKTLTVVIPPHNAEEAGGMEYPTFFTAEGYAQVEPTLATSTCWTSSPSTNSATATSTACWRTTSSKSRCWTKA